MQPLLSGLPREHYEEELHRRSQPYRCGRSATQSDPCPCGLNIGREHRTAQRVWLRASRNGCIEFGRDSHHCCAFPVSDQHDKRYVMRHQEHRNPEGRYPICRTHENGSPIDGRQGNGDGEINDAFNGEQPHEKTRLLPMAGIALKASSAASKRHRLLGRRTAWGGPHRGRLGQETSAQDVVTHATAESAAGPFTVSSRGVPERYTPWRPPKTPECCKAD